MHKFSSDTIAIFIIFSLLILNSYSQRVDKINANSYENVILTTEKPVIVHVFIDDTLYSFDQARIKYFELFNYYNLNCTDPNNYDYAVNTLGVKKFPSVIVYPVGKPKRNNNKFTFSDGINLNELHEEISEIIGDETKTLTKDNVQIFINDHYYEKTPSFIYFYQDDEVDIAYRVITQLKKYADNFNFGHFKNPTKDEMKHYGAESLPFLLAMYLEDPNNEDLDPKKNVKVEHFSGRYTYAELTSFFEHYIPKAEEGRKYTKSNRRRKNKRSQSKDEL